MSWKDKTDNKALAYLILWYMIFSLVKDKVTLKFIHEDY